MNFLHLLTLIFVIAKLIGVPAVVAWSWWLVFAPSLFVFGFALFFIISAIIIACLGAASK